jgi:hypothetical protein
LRRACEKIKCFGSAIFNIPETVISQSAASEGSAAVSGRDRKSWLASCSALAVALLLLAAMLSTLFKKTSSTPCRSRDGPVNYMP